MHSVILIHYTAGTPIGALTGTADEHTQATIKSLLCMRPNAVSIYVSPSRPKFEIYCEENKKSKAATAAYMACDNAKREWQRCTQDHYIL